MILGCIYTINILCTSHVFFCHVQKTQIQQNAPTNLAKRNTDMAFSKTMCHQCRCVCLCRTTIASLRSFSETSKNWVFSYRNLLKYINFRVCIEYIRKDTGMSFLTGDFTGSCIELNNCICNLYKLSELTRHFVEQHHLKYISYRCRYIFTGSNTMLDL